MNKKPLYTLVKPDPSTDDGYVELETQNKQLTWLIQVEGKTVGISWINLEGDEYIDPPHVYVMVDEAYRGQGIGSGVLKDMIKYAYCNLTSEILYSRQQTNDKVTEKLNKKLGFEIDEKPYEDENGQQWQNVKLIL
jgi:GNAT superfamily N-acetyltransferase